MTGESIQYFVFDIESVADGELIRKVRFPGGERLHPLHLSDTHIDRDRQGE